MKALILAACTTLLAATGCSHVAPSSETGLSKPSATTHLVGTGGGPVDEADPSSPPTMADLEEKAQARLENTSRLCDELEARQDWDDAAHCYAELAQDNSSSELLDAWLVKSASNFERLGDRARAQIVRLFLIQHRPYSDYAPDILVIIADDFRDHQAREQALPFYATYLQAFPDGPHYTYVREQCEALGGCPDYDWEPM
jgi:hypothetical protein